MTGTLFTTEDDEEIMFSKEWLINSTGMLQGKERLARDNEIIQLLLK